MEKKVAYNSLTIKFLSESEEKNNENPVCLLTRYIEAIFLFSNRASNIMLFMFLSLHYFFK